MSVPYQQTIVGRRDGPHLLILAGVHGDEYEPIAAVLQLMESLKPEELCGRVTLVPVLNGPAYSRLQRTGPDGLDLARTFPGRHDGSESEAIAAQATEWIRSADYLIDLHTGGLAFRISPLAGYMLHPDEAIHKTQRRMAEAFNLPIVWGTTAELHGRSLSAARDAGVPAIYTEWGGGGGCDAEGVVDYVTGCRNVLAELGLLERLPTNSRVQYIVEDFRNQSGVLQINYPAPAGGFFEPACRLNDIVRPGDLLGRIHSLHGEPSITVTSQQNGLVLLIRALPVVQPGDALAVVLEITEPGEVRHE